MFDNGSPLRLRAKTKNVDIRESVAVLALLTAIPANRLAALALAELLSGRRGLERACEGTCRLGARGVEMTIATALDNGQRSPRKLSAPSSRGSSAAMTEAEVHELGGDEASSARRQVDAHQRP
jgi:hypothetical protein